MKTISYLSVILILSCVLVCSASGAPTANGDAARGMIAAPDVAQPVTDATAQVLGRRQAPEPPKSEGLHKLAEVPKKFAFAAGGVVLGIVWLVVKIVLVVLLILTVVYYVRLRRGAGGVAREDRGVATLAKAFDQAVARVKSKRKELQAQVNVLAKREGVIAPTKKKVARKPKGKK